MGHLPSMGDYGLYIAMSYGLTLIFMLLEPWLLGRNRHAVIKTIKRLIQINKNRNHSR